MGSMEKEFFPLDQLADKVSRKNKLPFVLLWYIRRLNYLARKSDPVGFSSLIVCECIIDKTASNHVPFLA